MSAHFEIGIVCGKKNDSFIFLIGLSVFMLWKCENDTSGSARLNPSGESGVAMIYKMKNL